MSRIFWDSMVAVYLLEDHPLFAPRVMQILERSMKRNDLLFTSYLALGEILAGTAKSPQTGKDTAGKGRVGRDRILLFGI